MRRLPRVLALLACVLGGVMMAPTINADTVTIGTATGPHNYVPFGFEDFAGNSPYQQLYRGSNFGSGPVKITSMTFFVTGLQGTMNYVGQHVSLATAARWWEFARLWLYSELQDEKNLPSG